MSWFSVAWNNGPYVLFLWPRLKTKDIQIHNVSGDRHWLHKSCKYNYHTITTMMTPHKFYEDTSIIICVELLTTEPEEQQLLL
jgi:hypothetical protein